MLAFLIYFYLFFSTFFWFSTYLPGCPFLMLICRCCFCSSNVVLYPRPCQP